MRAIRPPGTVCAPVVPRTERPKRSPRKKKDATVCPRTDSLFHIRTVVYANHGVGADDFFKRLDRVAWEWASSDRITSRAICEPLIRAILEEELGAGTGAAVDRYTEEFCVMVQERRMRLAELERVERARQAWLRGVRKL